MKKDLLKRMVGITCAALLLLGAGVASAQSSSSAQSSTQSLGDAARAARKNKPQSETATHVYDNDNLPTTETLSVVGPAPSAQTSASQPTRQPAAVQESSAAEQRQKAADDIQNKLDAQKAKIDQLSHQLEQDQREYRLRAAEFYNDAGNRLRNAAQWDKEGTQYRNDMDSKQKALDDAKAQLSDTTGTGSQGRRERKRQRRNAQRQQQRES